MFQIYTKALIKQGHETSLLICDNKNCNYNISGVKKIFKLKNLSQISDFLYFLSILLIRRPDVVICHSNRIMKWMNVAKKIGFKVKSIAVNHGISFEKSLNCDYIININREINDMVVKKGFDRDKSHVIANVIEITKEYHPHKISDTPTIAIFGRIEPRKGFDILIKACQIIREQGIKFRLKIGGFEVPGGYNLQTIKDLAKECQIYENCEFVGTVHNKESFFQNVDIFTVPSREEPFGLVILEGASFSKLVISSNTQGGKMLIQDQETGLLFKNEDHKDLAQKLLFAIKNKEKSLEITRKSYQNLVKNYDFASFSQKIDQFLQKIA